MPRTRCEEMDDTGSDSDSARGTQITCDGNKQLETDHCSTFRAEYFASDKEEDSTDNSLDGHPTSHTAVLPHSWKISLPPNEEFLALLFAAAENISEAVSLFLECELDVNAADADGRTALHFAAFAGCSESVKRLVGAGASLTAVSSRGESVMHWAVAGRNTATMLLLLADLGADLDHADDLGQTALHAALFSGFHDGFRTLMELGASPFTCRSDGVTPLHTAAGKGDAAAVGWMLRSGVWPNARDDSLRSALHEAASAGSVDCALLLLDAGSDADCRDHLGRTPLHVAAGGRHADTVRLLLRRGAHVDGASRNLDRPLHLAAAAGDRETVAVLVGAGADVNASNAQWSTALHAAIEARHEQVVEYLLSLDETDVDRPDGRGRTAAQMMALKGVTSCTAAALAAGTLAFEILPQEKRAGGAADQSDILIDWLNHLRRG